MIKGIIHRVMVGIEYRLVKFYAKLIFPSIWDLKEYLQKYENKKGKIYSIFNSVYDSRLSYYGSWIGPGSVFSTLPLFPHGIMSIFISNGAVIGKNCVIFQQVTIGSNTLKDSNKFGSPIIGDNVYIGAGAKIIGNVKVGNNCRIGANAVVAKDLSDNSVIVPEMKIISKPGKMDNRFYSKRNGGWSYYDFNTGTFVNIESITNK